MRFNPASSLVLVCALAACQGPVPEALPTELGTQPGAEGVLPGGGDGQALAPEQGPRQGPSPVPQGKGLLFVGITERDGKPLVGADVTVLRLDTNQPVANATTYDDGSFAIQFGADLPPTLPIKVVAKLNGEALGAVVAGGPLAIIAGGAGNIIAGGAGNIIAGGAGNVIAGGAGNVIAGGAGNILAGGAGNILAGGAGNIIAGGAGNILAGGAGNVIAGGAGNILAGGAGNIIAGGAGNILAGGAGNIIAGGAGNVVAGGAGNLSAGLPPSAQASIVQAGQILAGGAGNLKTGNVLNGGVGNVIVAAPASLKAAVASGIIAGGAGNIIAGGAGNIIAGGAGNIIAGGAGNILAGGAGNYRLSQAASPSPTATIPAVRLSMASTAAVLILEKRVRAYAQATGQNFIQVAAVVADAVFEGLTGFLATSPSLQSDQAAQRLVATALAEGQSALPPTVARNLAEATQGLDATIVDAAVRLGLVVLGTATATDLRPSDEVLSGYEVGQANLPPVSLPASVGSNSAPVAQPTSGSSSGSSAVVAAPFSPGPNPIALPSGGVGALGNPSLNGPGPIASSLPTHFTNFAPATNPGPAVYDAACFVHNSRLFVVGGATSSATQSQGVFMASLDSNGQPGAFTSLSNLPGAVSDAAAVLVGDKAYVIGGRNASGPTNSIYVADLNTTNPSFVAAGSLLVTPVNGASALKTGPNRILVVGGQASLGPSKAVQSLDLSFDPPFVNQDGFLSAGANLTSGMVRASAFLIPSPYRMALVGGFDSAADPVLRRTEVHLNTNGSPMMDNGAVAASATDISSSNDLRRTHAAAVQDLSSSHAYFFGGRFASTSSAGLNQVRQYRWDATNLLFLNSEQPSGVSLHLARSGHSAVLFGRKVLIVGGRTSSTGVPTSVIEIGQLP